jgi:hypothetical protein
VKEVPEFGDMQMSDITPEVVQDFINRKAKEGKEFRLSRI